MRAIIDKVLDGYGSFFALSHPASRILIFVASILQPLSGVCGVLGALSVIFWRSILQFNRETERIEIINGLLLGMLLGSLYGISAASVAMTVFGGLLVILVSAFVSDTAGRFWRLPLLGLPYSLVAFMLLPFAAALRLPHALQAGQSCYLPCDIVFPVGAMYFNGTAVGGILVLLAFFLSSRYLALLALASSFIASIALQCMGVPDASLISLLARMNAVLVACVIGGLFAVPGLRSLLVSAFASVFAAALTLSLDNLLGVLGLPVLALPFVLVFYVCMLVLNGYRGPAWSGFWLSVPALPELSIERIQIARARGVDFRDIALRAPFKGLWQVYQGFGGKHTHQGNWHFALDFFQTEQGFSFTGDGKELFDYYCYGSPVLSPAYGVVSDLRQDLPDNSPGEVDVLHNWGNYVLIRLDCGAYVILSHLQQQSVKVSVGDRVRPGDCLAAVGNSGRSPQPHLHMHVQDAAYLGARTMPFHLTGVVLKQDEQDRFEMACRPDDNDIVAVPAVNHALKRCLRLSVGNRFVYNVESGKEPSSIRELFVVLDLNGQFWLESDRGGRVAFTLNDSLLCFYDRQGKADSFLDSFILAVASMPLIEGSPFWSDRLPSCLFERKRAARFIHSIRHPFSPCSRSSYRRAWDSRLKLWVQSSTHKMGDWFCESKAHICEAQGITDFETVVEGKVCLRAELMRLGAREDNGIPEWTGSLPQHS